MAWRRLRVGRDVRIHAMGARNLRLATQLFRRFAIASQMSKASMLFKSSEQVSSPAGPAMPRASVGSPKLQRWKHQHIAVMSAKAHLEQRTKVYDAYMPRHGLQIELIYPAERKLHYRP